MGLFSPFFPITFELFVPISRKSPSCLLAIGATQTPILKIELTESKHAWYFLPAGTNRIVDPFDERNPIDHTQKEKPGRGKFCYGVIIDLRSEYGALFLKLKHLTFP